MDHPAALTTIPRATVVDEAHIAAAVARLSLELLTDLAQYDDPLLLVVLNGAFMFAADLLRLLPAKYEVDFAHVSSYRGKTSGALSILYPTWTNVRGRVVYTIDDIFDTGQTAFELRQFCLTRGATAVKSVVLLQKQLRIPDSARLDIYPDFVGIMVPDVFVVGYGLDYNGRYRQLPYVSQVE